MCDFFWLDFDEIDGWGFFFCGVGFFFGVDIVKVFNYCNDLSFIVCVY